MGLPGTVFQPDFGAVTAFTITSLASLANNGYAGSLVVDNSANLWEDVLVGVTIASGSSGTSSSGTCVVYAYADVDGTPNYTDSMTGADATQAPTAPTNLKAIGVINVVANSTTYRGGRFSVAKAFGGWLPRKFGIVVLNSTGAALSSSGSSANFQPINEQVP